MCFGSPPPPPPAPTPAASPAPPSPTAEAQPVDGPRKASDLALYGSSSPSLRVDRSATSAGVGQGGSGIKV